MRKFRLPALAAAAGLMTTMVTPVRAQVAVSVGVAPVCPYGYFDYAPYSCAPVGYYGPQWFVGGAFVGAGPWFHGPASFHGTVNNRFDPQHGYKGALPQHQDKPVAADRAKATQHFQGNEERDGRGHVAEAKR